MRRLALLLLAAAPALALGQSVTFRSTTNANLQAINLAQCNGASRSDLGLSDDMTLDLSWTIKAADSSTTPGTTGIYRIYVSKNASQAGQTLTSSTVGTDCTKDTSNNNLNPFPTVLVDNISATSTPRQNDVSMAALAAAAGYSCSDGSKPTIYVCVQQLNGSTILGYATGSLVLDLTKPPKPTTPSVVPGDGSLHIDCSAGSGDAVGSGGGYKARATPTNTTMQPSFSNEGTSCGDLVVKSLVNGQSYDVVVYRLNENHNPSDPSDPQTGTPVVTNDLWNQYKNSGGRESGGCNTPAGGAGMLGALAALATLAALRRRNS